MKISYPVIIAVRINALTRGFINDAFYRIYEGKDKQGNTPPLLAIHFGV